MTRYCWPLLAWALLLLAGGHGARAEEPRRSWRILGPDGFPLEHVQITRVTELHQRGPLLDASARWTVRAAPDGILELPVPGLADDRPHVVTADQLAATVLPTTAGAVGVRLLRARPLGGTLRFEGDEPAADLPLLAIPHGRAGLVHRTRSDTDGRFAFDHVGSGTWEVAVHRGDGRLLSIGLFVAGASRVGTLLRAGSRVEGQLLDADASRRTGVGGLGLRIVRLPLEAGESENARAHVFQAAEDGTFTLLDVPAGVYEARLVAEGRAEYAFEPSAPRFEAPPSGRVRLRGWYVRRLRAIEGCVQDPDRRPVAGVAVSLVPDATLPEPRGGWPDVSPVRTGVDGTFRLEGVVPATGYRVAYDRPGFAPLLGVPFVVVGPAPTRLDTVFLGRGWRLEVLARAPGGAPRVGARVRVAPAGVAVLAPREGRTGADGRLVIGDLPSGDVRVETTADGLLAVTGTVAEPRSGDTRLWNVTLLEAPILEGRLVREAARGAPPGLEVHVFPRDGSDPRAADPDALGRFRVGDLPAGPVDVEVRRGDGRVLARVSGVLPGVDDDLTIPLPTLVGLKGWVLGARSGEGRVEVLLEAPVFDPTRDEHRWRIAAAQQLGEGGEGRALPGRRAVFAFDGLAPGVYSLRARQGNVDTGATVLVVEADVESVALELPRPGRVAGSVIDDRALPILGAEVRLLRLRGAGEPCDLPGGPLRQVTDTEGGFVFPDVAPGPWRLEVQDFGRAGDEIFLRVGAGESLVLEDLVMAAGGAIEGTVADEDGRALDGVRLWLEPADVDAPARVLTSGRDGRFAVDSLRPGAWRLSFPSGTARYGNAAEVLVEVVSDEVTEVNLSAGGSARVEGLVQREGRPVANATLYLLRQGVTTTGVLARRSVSRTDGDGRFEWRGLEGGTYLVDLVEGGLRREHDAVQVRDGETVTLELELYAGRLPGQVLLPSGRGAAGVTVIARPTGAGAAGLEARVQTDPAGTFLFTGLPIRFYDLVVSSPGLPPGRYHGAVAEGVGAERPVTIALGMGGTLDLEVANDQGRGVGATRVWLEDAEGAPLNPSPYITVPSGRLLIEGVPEGTWWLRVQAARYGRPARQSLKIVEGEVTPVVVTLLEAARIQLEVSTRNLDPTTRARVDLLRLPGREAVERRRTLRRIRLRAPWGRLPRTGRLEIDDLAPGQYLLQVDAGRAFDVAEVVVEVPGGGEDVEVRVDLFEAGSFEPEPEPEPEEDPAPGGEER